MAAGIDPGRAVIFTHSQVAELNQLVLPFLSLEPEALMGTAPLLLGLDGRKMGKSRGNAVALGTSADETVRLIRARLAPIRARRAELAGERDHLRAVLAQGSARAQEIAGETLRAVKELMHTRYR